MEAPTSFDAGGVRGRAVAPAGGGVAGAAATTRRGRGEGVGEWRVGASGFSGRTWSGRRMPPVKSSSAQNGEAAVSGWSNAEGKLTKATVFAPNVTECYFQVMLHSFDNILRSDEILMVFRGNSDLLML